jgi:hypothetical protein
MGKGFTGLAGSILVGAIVLAPFLLPPTAQAASGREISKLLHQPCPRYRAMAQAASIPPEIVDDARQGIFRIRGQRFALPKVGWHYDPIHSHAFREEINKWGWSTPLAYLYMTEHNLDAVRRARSLALDWFRRNAPARALREAWVDKVVADRAGFISYFTRVAACESLLTRRQAGKLLDGIRASGIFTANPRHYNSRVANHGLFQDFGLALIKGYFPYMEGSKGWGTLASRRFVSLLRAHLSRQGQWLEHSAGYQIKVERLVEDFIEIAQGAASRSVVALRNKMLNAAGWLTEPDQMLVPWGDTDYVGVAPDIQATERDGFSPLRSGGWSILRSGQSWLGMTSTYYSDVHKHADETSFDLYDRGLRIISDSGRYTNEANAIRSVAISPKAHSLLTVDGRSFPRRPKFGSGILGQASSNGWYAIAGANPRLGPLGVSETRYLFFSPGRYLAVLDRVRSRKVHTYRRYFQFGPKIEVATDPADPSALQLSSADPAFAGYWQDAAKGSVTLLHGDDPSSLGYYFPAWREKQPRWTAISENRARGMTALSVFNLQAGTPMAASASVLRGGAVRIKLDSTTLTANLKPRRQISFTATP